MQHNSFTIHHNAQWNLNEILKGRFYNVWIHKVMWPQASTYDIRCISLDNLLTRSDACAAREGHRRSRDVVDKLR